MNLLNAWLRPHCAVVLFGATAIAQDVQDLEWTRMRRQNGLD
jgi:hypothetical protein